MTEENFKPIVGYEGLYEVSDMGTVRSVSRLVPQKSGTLQYKPGKILRQAITWDRYKSVGLSKEGKVTTFRVHRLVASAFVNNPENKPLVNHRDRDRQNNKALNLEWSTNQENIVHGYDTTGFASNGSKGHRVKLNETVVREIISKHATGCYSFLELAKEYSLHHSSVMRIVKGKSWKHITANEHNLNTIRL